MATVAEAASPDSVALPTEGVDRNAKLVFSRKCDVVALPTEGVDRNLAALQALPRLL